MTKRSIRPSLRTLGILFGALLLLSTAGVSLVRWADIHYAGETLKDAWGRWRFHEEWGSAPVLRAQQDYRWVAPGMLVAHALGGSGSDEQNTLSTMDKSLALGLKVLEIDVWLDQQGQLRCHHGPEHPAALKTGECTWDKALQKANAADAWLVLDLKTDFRKTAQALLDRLPNTQAADHIIFQLYKPDHISLFAEWQKQYPLPGPIITSYIAKRSMQHVAQNAQRVGVQVLTLPLYRRAALKNDATGLHILVHPIHDCTELRLAAPAAGYYVTADGARLIRQECKEQLQG